MAENNEVFIFNKDLHETLPIEEGKKSIYGVRPSYMFHQNDQNISNNSRIFQRETFNSQQRFFSPHQFDGSEFLNKSKSAQVLRYDQQDGGDNNNGA